VSKAVDTYASYDQPITLKYCAWGTGAMILKGVTVRGGSIIGAGAVVTYDIPADNIAVGNPAKIIRKILD
jgi:acetyltransferase-like isoleucine patch superfamily enzyme